MFIEKYALENGSKPWTIESLQILIFCNIKIEIAHAIKEKRENNNINGSSIKPLSAPMRFKILISFFLKSIRKEVELCTMNINSAMTTIKIEAKSVQRSFTRLLSFFAVSAEKTTESISGKSFIRSLILSPDVRSFISTLIVYGKGFLLRELIMSLYCGKTFKKSSIACVLVIKETDFTPSIDLISPVVFVISSGVESSLKNAVILSLLVTESELWKSFVPIIYVEPSVTMPIVKKITVIKIIFLLSLNKSKVCLIM